MTGILATFILFALSIAGMAMANLLRVRKKPEGCLRETSCKMAEGCQTISHANDPEETQ